jgi:hypothetical protein
MSRLHITALLLIAAFAWGTVLSASGIALPEGWFGPLSTVVSVLVVALLIFDTWLWRIRLLHPWFVAIPDLRGTWAGTLKSDWINPKTGERVPAITVYFVVRQTYSRTSLRLMTSESTSKLLGGAIVREDDGRYVVSGVYLNTPKLDVRDRSPIHHGAVLLSVEGTPPQCLSGQYWTDRSTKGQIRLDRKSATLYDSYEDAAAGMA